MYPGLVAGAKSVLWADASSYCIDCLARWLSAADRIERSCSSCRIFRTEPNKVGRDNLPVAGTELTDSGLVPIKGKRWWYVIEELMCSPNHDKSLLTQNGF